MTKKLFFALLIISVQVQAKGYYVSIFGLNTNPGTVSLPFKTIQYGLDQAIAGDSVFVQAGTYSEKIYFNISGTSGKYIYLIGLNKPKISGTGLTPAGQEGLINIINKSYIYVEGFEIADFITTNSFPVGIWVEGKGGFITIKNNYIHHIQCNKGAHGVAFYGSSSAEALHDLVFSGNEVAFCKTFSSEATVWNGNVRNFLIENNSVHDCDNIAYDFIGWEGTCGSCTGLTGSNVDRARDGTVRNNIAYNITSWGNPAYGNASAAGGFYVDGGDNILFERNISHDCDLGFELASEWYGKATSRIIVRNNLVYNNYAVGISTGGYSAGTGGGGGSAENCIVVNNTIYKNNTSPNNDAWGAELLLQNRNINNRYSNNIIYAGTGFPRVDNSGQYNTGTIFSNNLYFGSTTGTAPGTNPVTGQNPLFVNEAVFDFHLHPTSPAINKGLQMGQDTLGTTDYYGSIRFNGIVDMGASENQTGTWLTRNENDLDERIIVFPNPSRHGFEISRPEKTRLIIYDISGREIFTAVSEDTEIISIGNEWIPGIYFLFTETGSETIKHMKLVKIR